MTADTGFLRLETATAARRLPNGLELQTAGGVLQVSALADGILRICFRPGGLPAPSTSWAVLPGSMQATADVAHVSAPGTARFATADLDVTVSLDPLHLRIADPQGHVLMQDGPARPVEFTGPVFRAWKSSPPDAHYYGLGDKPGRLDRKGRAVRLWNTDDPTWRESDDLLYKAIPFVLGLCQGRAWGLLLDNTWRSAFEFGVSVSDAFSFGAEGGLLDYYVLAGPDPKTVLRRYAALTGLRRCRRCGHWAFIKAATVIHPPRACRKSPRHTATARFPWTSSGSTSGIRTATALLLSIQMYFRIWAA